MCDGLMKSSPRKGARGWHGTTSTTLKWVLSFVDDCVNWHWRKYILVCQPNNDDLGVNNGHCPYRRRWHLRRVYNMSAKKWTRRSLHLPCPINRVELEEISDERKQFKWHRPSTLVGSRGGLRAVCSYFWFGPSTWSIIKHKLGDDHTDSLVSNQEHP
jgi:hypothetical protein